MNSSPSGRGRMTRPCLRVALAVADPDLAADVRAVLAAVGIDEVRGGAASDLLVTDSVAPPSVPGDASRTIRVRTDAELPDEAAATGAGAGPAVRLPSGSGDLIRLLEAAGGPGTGVSVAVWSAVGGCGASTLAAAVAIRAAVTRRVLLAETDPDGAGVDVLLGLEDEPGVGACDLRVDLGHLDVEAVWGAVARVGPRVGVLPVRRVRAGLPGGREPLTQAATRAGVVGAAVRRSGDVVVFDAGRPRDGSHETGADLDVVVTRCDVSGALAAREALDRLPSSLLVVRAEAGAPIPASDVAATCGLDDWEVLRDHRRVRARVGAGGLVAALRPKRPRGMSSLARTADAVVEAVGADVR